MSSSLPTWESLLHRISRSRWPTGIILQLEILAVDGLTGTNEPEDSYIQEPDEYLEQDNLDPIEEANDSFTLPEEINGMEEIQTEDAQMPMNMELLRNPHRIREIPKSRSELRGQKQGDRDTGSLED